MASRIIFLMGNSSERTMNLVSGMIFQIEKMLGNLYQVQEECMWNELKYSININKDVQEQLVSKLREIYKDQFDTSVKLVFLND